MKEYKGIIGQMYSHLCDFVANNSDVEEELFEKEKEFLRLSFDGCNERKLFFDWFVFDYTLKKYNKRLFDVFLNLEQKKISKDLYDVYSKVGRDHFSFFKVKAVKIGKQFLCHDAVTSMEYEVFDSALTKSIGKGDYVIGRLLPFDDAFILASHCLCYAKQDYDMFSIVLKNASTVSGKRIDAYDVYKALYPQKVPEKLSVEGKFELLCKEGGLSDYEIEDILLEARIAIKEKNETPQKVMFRIIEKMKEPEHFNKEEFYDAFVAMWNFFVGQIHEGAKKGPIEIALINICMDVVMTQFPQPQKMSEKEKKDLSARIQKWTDKWFITSQEELNGKTPKQVIMQERKKLGNPQKDFGFQLEIECVSADWPKEKKAEKLFNRATGRMEKGEYQGALELYQDYLKLWEENHVVWHNMGVCYVMLLQKRKAEKCFKSALMIKPDYDLANKKLEDLMSMHKEDMVRMAKTIRKNRAGI